MADPDIAIIRVFDAPRELVWREWTEPERFADWFGGPSTDIPLDTVTMDVRPGGPWRLTMFAEPGRRRIDWHGEYLEVDAPRRLVFSVSDQPEGSRYAFVTVVLNDLRDGRTEMRFEQRGGPPPEAMEAAKQGWSGFFDRIAERLRS